MTHYKIETVKERFINGHPEWEREIQGDDLIGSDFDRWLAEYTRQQREEAWDDGYHAVREGDYDYFLRDYPEADVNPYRSAS